MFLNILYEKGIIKGIKEEYSNLQTAYANILELL